MTVSRGDGSQYDSRKTLSLSQKTVRRICPIKRQVIRKISKFQFFKREILHLIDSIFPVDGQWGAWRASGQCSQSCGGGTQYHARRCDSPAPANGGNYCQGEHYQYSPCNEKKCKLTKLVVKYQVAIESYNIQNYTY